MAVQNDSERGPIAVSVEVEGVEIRSAESVETEEKNASGEDLLLLTDTFWNNVTKVVYYDFNEDIYELSNAGKLEKLQAIFKGMEYKEIENPWIEGWYMFEIHTDEKTYDMGITGNTISFDGKFYEATDSIAKEVTKMMKSETVSKEWTEEEILELFKTKANMDYTFVTCASVFDFAYERVGVILYTDSKDGYIYVAFMDEEGNMQHCGVEATLVDLPEFIYWGNGEVTFKVCSKDGKYYTQKLSFSIDENKVNFVSEAIEDISEESISELKEKYNLMEPEEEKVSSKVDVGVSVGIDN